MLLLKIASAADEAQTMTHTDAATWRRVDLIQQLEILEQARARAEADAVPAIDARIVFFRDLLQSADASPTGAVGPDAHRSVGPEDEDRSDPQAPPEQP